MSKIITGLMVLSLLAMQGCRTGYNKRYISNNDNLDPPNCEQAPNNTDISAEALSVFNLIARLTCNEATKDGALLGQNTGFGNQIVEENGTRSYSKLVGAMSKKPTILSIDYEHDKIFTADQLQAANEQLKVHWDAGGIIMISWMPLNPWQNQGTDAAGNPGSAANLAHTNEVNLANLVDENHADYTTWHNRLDTIAEALQYLEDNNIAVMWRPLPAMNTSDRYWWGLTASYDGDSESDSAALYTDIWKDMYTYFTEEKELDNLIWVYSPAEGGDLPDDASVSWAYPGDEYVDVVGAIAQNDALNIPDYEAINDLGKPFGMAQYNPLPHNEGGQFAGTGAFTGDGTDAGGATSVFDNRTYSDRLEGSYENVAFWVTWHSYSHEIGHSNLAFVHNEYASQMANKSYILDLTTVVNENMR